MIYMSYENHHLIIVKSICDNIIKFETQDIAKARFIFKRKISAREILLFEYKYIGEL